MTTAATNKDNDFFTQAFPEDDFTRQVAHIIVLERLFGESE